MRSLSCSLALLLAAPGGCSSSDESLAPVPTCAPTQPPSGWPAEPGVLQLDAPSSTGPFTPAPHRAAPALTVERPIVLVNPRLVTVLAADDPLADTLFSFSDAVPTSAWWEAVTAEYGVGSLRGGAHVLGPPMSGPVTNGGMIAYVRAAIAGAEAAPDGSTIYLLYLAPGVESVDGHDHQNCGCSQQSGAHFRFDDRGDAIAFVQRCSAADTDGLTVTASHEILEAATDPRVGGGYLEAVVTPAWTGSVWAAIQPGADELADLCSGTRIHEDPWEYQRSFSNLAAAGGGDPCAPALAEPYYNVTVARDWYPIAAGATAVVPVLGWSTAARDDWFVYPRLATANEVGFEAAVTSAESSTTAAGAAFYGINNGKEATLTVTAPQARSGSYAVVRLVSRASSPGSDTLHFWPVGFYVP